MSARASSARRVARAALAMLVAAATLAAPRPAAAQLVRAFAPRFTANATGDVTLIGNTIMTCSGGGNCTNGQGGKGGNIDNNDFTMVYVDVDGDPTTFSSSTADLSLPAGATVLWAGLYWGGQSANAARNTVKLGTPVAGYATVTAAQVDVSTSDYAAFADVTVPVRAGGNGTYKVANVQSTPNASNIHGGWSLVVVYNLATLPPRNLVVFDGYAHVNTGTNVTINVNGFVTPPAGVVNSKLGVVAFEGDLGLTGDSFILNGFTLTDSRNPADNFFNSSVSVLGATFTAKNPNYLDQLGFDADLILTSGILPNSATSTTIQLTSNGDEYYPEAVAFATDLYAPVFSSAGFTKTVTDLNGGAVRAGDVLEYAVTMNNSGQDHAVQCVMRDTLPANATYVPGSLTVVSGPNAGAKTDAGGDDQMEYVAATRTVVARLGTGANGVSGGQINIGTTTSVKFRVTVNAPAPTGGTVSNQGWLTFNAALSGQSFVASSDGDAVTPGAQPTVVTTTGSVFSGTVFEDANYGGGAGRSLAAAAGAARPGARVELYSSAGAFLAADTTDASGVYHFRGWGAGGYVVRVVNASVTSARPGATSALLGVPTYRTDASTGAAVAVTDRVGGETPALADAAANVTNATLASLTTASTTAQSVAPVTLATADLAGVDFGFNFDTIVNAKDSGPGTLRQFVINANALGNVGLAQSGQSAGVENAIFMIADGAAHSGVRAGLANLLTAGVARITLLSALPALTDAATRVNGATQTADIGNTNLGVLGAGGTVGADGLPLGTLDGPEVEVRDGAGLAIGFDLQGASQSLVALAVLGFGNAAGSDLNADVRVGATANGVTLDRCVLGTRAAAFADTVSLRSGGDHLRVVGGDNGVVTNCLIGFGAGNGVSLTGASNGWSFTNCEIRGNAIGNGARAGVSIESSAGTTITQCLVTANEGAGIDAATSNGANTLTNCTVSRNGVGTAAGTVTAGVRLGGLGTRVDRGVVRDNYGAGVLVVSTGGNHTITRTLTSGNGTTSNNGGAGATGEIGIDLLSAADNATTGTAPFVTPNDFGDGDAGGNALLNFPVLESAVLSNGNFTITGWARPGATIELFVSDGDPRGFGEGAAYVATLVEGSAADLDAGSSRYGSPFNGLAQGTDSTTRFRFTLAAPSGVSPGVRLTATATLSGLGTSEFSGVVAVSTGVSVSGWVYADANHNTQRDAGEAGAGAALYAKLVPSGALSAQQVVSADPATGAFAFTFVNAALFNVVLDTSNDPNDVTPGAPAGWIGTEAASGLRSGLAVSGTDVANQNFGLWHGSALAGTVFRDDGGAGGVANDGAKQAGESAIAAARVRLESAACAGGACDSALTDGAGAFTLWLPFAAAGLGAGVREVNPAGWISTGGSAGTTGGSYARASDLVSFTAAAGLRYSGLSFGDVPPNVWAAPGARTVAAGGAAAYAHTFTAGSAGSVTFAAAQTTAPPLPGWTTSLFRDLNCNGVLDAGDPALVGPIVLSAGQSACVIARESSPAGAPNGASATATLTASFVYSAASPALAGARSLDDLTSVIAAGSGLVLAKSVDRASARPGDALTYTITYTNLGSQPVSSIVINDATPSFTQFASAACGALGGGLTGCALTAQPAVGASGSVRWTLSGALAPGASGSVSFVVRVQ